MQKKIYIQILLFTIVFILIGSTFYFYIFDDGKIKNKIESFDAKKISIDDKSYNTIENLNYSSKDNFGNEFKINAKKGHVSTDNENIIHMLDVNATIYMKNSKPIYIKADFADYNSRNYDTFFKENILLTHLDHQITGEKLSLLFKINLVTMSDNLIYKNIDTVLNADRFEMDLITKDSKILMNKKSEKIKIVVKK